MTWGVASGDKIVGARTKEGMGVKMGCFFNMRLLPLSTEITSVRVLGFLFFVDGLSVGERGGGAENRVGVVGCCGGPDQG